MLWWFYGVGYPVDISDLSVYEIIEISLVISSVYYLILRLFIYDVKFKLTLFNFEIFIFYDMLLLYYDVFPLFPPSYTFCGFLIAYIKW